MSTTGGGGNGGGHNANNTIHVEGEVRSVAPAPAPLDYTNSVVTVLEQMSVQTNSQNIPLFDGRQPPLKDFLQEIENSAAFIPEVSEPGFLKAVLSKLRGAARNSVRGLRFDNINGLVEHLRKRFASSKKYQWYLDNIMTIRLKQTETVSDYHDRLRGLVSGARHALEMKYNKVYREITENERGERERGPDILESEIIMQPIVENAFRAFVRGLPDEMSTFVDTRNPGNLQEAFEHALYAEERRNYAERTRASLYHITRSDDRARSPSPYSRQVENHPSSERRRTESDRENGSARPSRNQSSGMMQFTPEQLAAFYQSMMPSLQPITYAPPAPTASHPLQSTRATPYAPTPPQQPYQLYRPQNQGYRSSNTPPRSISPSPNPNPTFQKPDLNFQQTRRSDAAASPTLQRQRSVHFAPDQVGSVEQSLREKIPQ